MAQSKTTGLPKLDLKVTALPEEVEAGKPVEVKVEIENFNPELTYKVDHWETETGEIPLSAPTRFEGNKTLTANWSTSDMNPGDHAVTVHVDAQDKAGNRATGSESAIITILESPLNVILALEEDCSKGEVKSVRQGQLVCMSAEIENPNLDFTYTPRFVTEVGNITRIEQVNEHKWRAFVDTEHLRTGLQKVQVFIKTSPKPATKSKV